MNKRGPRSQQRRGGQKPSQGRPSPSAKDGAKGAPSNDRRGPKSDARPGREDARAPRQKAPPREDIVAGRHATKSVLEGQPTRAKRLLTTTSNESDPVIVAAMHADVAIRRVDKGQLDDISGGLLHQGYVLEVGPYPYVELEDALAEGSNLALVLDEVEDPRNLGAAARAAYALGADLLVIPERRAARVTASAEKTAAGALAHLRVARPGNLRRALAAMKADGMWVVGGDHRTELAPWNVDLGDRVVIIVGAEEDGMRRLTREACDHIVAIPMAADGMSLNAADAATVLLYESARQRAAKGD